MDMSFSDPENFFHFCRALLCSSCPQLLSPKPLLYSKLKDNGVKSNKFPLILAPAGGKAAFLAALAAGADAVYCGLKLFSARMEADNFSLQELASLSALAHSKGVEVHVALNSLLKPDELDKAGRLLDRLNRFVHPDALIIQDLALVDLARQTGYKGDLHLSTLANFSLPDALPWIRRTMGISQVVLPRELNIDEIRSMAAGCPPELSLEVFIHGALCYGISGRCYWSSFLGGKSSLRGRCVQPCRRRYQLEGPSQRYFSCRDLSLDVLVKVLLDIPQIRTWKIEGRKKGPHYVYYTVQAYRMLRDHGTDPTAKKNAIDYLQQALGREGSHYLFLPQRPQNPVDVHSRTGSGLFLGKVQGGRQRYYLTTRNELFSGDLLRVGYEDDPGHALIRVGRAVPKRGRLYLRFPVRKPGSLHSAGSRPEVCHGLPVFLIDRREPYLNRLIKTLENEQLQIPSPIFPPSGFKAKVSRRKICRRPVRIMTVRRQLSGKSIRRDGSSALWVSAEAIGALSKGAIQYIWWWLPPVIWPGDEGMLQQQIRNIIGWKGRNFVLNAPWQIAWFSQTKSFNLWAGPFCNIGNGLALNLLKNIGFSGAVVSPELGKDDYFNLVQQSPLPLGIVLSGLWPLTLSRTLSEALEVGKVLSSPKGEHLWIAKHDSNYWLYPNWELNLQPYREQLQKAGYSMFVKLNEPLPSHVKLKDRPGLWNWELRLL
jgi:putative protease